MKKTAHRSVGVTAANLNPTPINYRPEPSYHERETKRPWIDKVVFVVVGFLALIIISLSFGNTGTLAETLELNPWLAAGMVEVLFGTLLVIRGRQRALQRNVPLFLDAGYFSSLAFVTVVNMWGLGQIHPIGFVVGAAITGAMWLMENTLVWLSTDSEKPHEKTVKELQKEAEKEIKKIKALQRIEWMRWEAQKPNLDLVKEARKAELKRKQVVGDGLPEFFEGTSEKVEEPQESHEEISKNEEPQKTSEKAEEPHEQSQKTSEKIEEPHEETQETFTPDEAAAKIYEDTKRLPKIREIEELAGCKEWPARQARAKLKEQIEEPKAKVLQLRARD